MPTKPFKKEKFPVYLTAHERAVVRIVAANAQLSISEWIRTAVLQHPDFLMTRGALKTGQPIFGNEKDILADMYSVPTKNPPGRPPGNGRKGPLFGDDDDTQS